MCVWKVEDKRVEKRGTFIIMKEITSHPERGRAKQRFFAWMCSITKIKPMIVCRGIYTKLHHILLYFAQSATFLKSHFYNHIPASSKYTPLFLYRVKQDKGRYSGQCTLSRRNGVSMTQTRNRIFSFAPNTPLFNNNKHLMIHNFMQATKRKRKRSSHINTASLSWQLSLSHKSLKLTNEYFKQDNETQCICGQNPPFLLGLGKHAVVP